MPGIDHHVVRRRHVAGSTFSAGATWLAMVMPGRVEDFGLMALITKFRFAVKRGMVGIGRQPDIAFVNQAPSCL